MSNGVLLRIVDDQIMQWIVKCPVNSINYEYRNEVYRILELLKLKDTFYCVTYNSGAQPPVRGPVPVREAIATVSYRNNK